MQWMSLDQITYTTSLSMCWAVKGAIVVLGESFKLCTIYFLNLTVIKTHISCSVSCDKIFTFSCKARWKKGTFDLHDSNFLGNTNACLLFWSQDEHEIHKVIFWLLPWIFIMLQIIFVHIFPHFFQWQILWNAFTLKNHFKSPDHHYQHHTKPKKKNVHIWKHHFRRSVMLALSLEDWHGR